MYTFQDLVRAKDEGRLEAFLAGAVEDYIGGAEYAEMLRNEAYFNGTNPAVFEYSSRVDVGGKSLDVFARIRVPSGLFGRLVTLQVNRLWYNGVQLDDAGLKARLGKGFDKTAKDITAYACVHGRCFGFWNYDTLTMFTAKEFLPFLDERTGEMKAGVRFWRVKEKSPWIVQLFEEDGWTEFCGDGCGIAGQARNDVLRLTRRDEYEGFPVAVMYANSRHKSELTEPIRAKIDLYDMIMTAFGDDVLKTNAVYWIFEGMSGRLDDLLETKRIIEKLGIAAWNDDTKARAETVRLPYAETMEFLGEIERAIFRDAMVTNPQDIMGGLVTATAINASYHAEKLKVSEMEWQACEFVERIMEIIGFASGFIGFKHEGVSNDLEVTQRLAMYGELPLEVKMKLDPLFPEGCV